MKPRKVDFEKKVLQELKMSTALRKSYLTMGPLRHMRSSDDRDKLLKKMVNSGLLRVETVSGSGPEARVYRLARAA